MIFPSSRQCCRLDIPYSPAFVRNERGGGKYAHRTGQNAYAIPAFAQRSAKVRLTNESGGCTRPVRVVELQPKRKIERETD